MTDVLGGKLFFLASKRALDKNMLGALSKVKNLSR